MIRINLMKDLIDIANINGLDTEANMPDYVIAEFLLASFEALMAANKENGKHFKSCENEGDLILDLIGVKP